MDDAVNMSLHHILGHLDTSGSYARLLFIDFSSAFNSVLPERLYEKLLALGVDLSISRWINDFLTNRSQQVRLGSHLSDPRVTNIGAPQGCVLSSFLYLLYTNDCISTNPTIRVIKYADDTTVLGLIKGNDESAYRQTVTDLAEWCSEHNLELNPLKTVEMVVDFQKDPPPLAPLIINNTTV